MFAYEIKKNKHKRNMKESKKHKDKMILVVCVWGGEREIERVGGGTPELPVEDDYSEDT